MRKYKLPLLLGLLLAGIITVWLLPSMLRSLPTRYAMRLPGPLQALALPADPTPILPTVAAPVAAAGLLGDAAATATPPASPTPQGVAEADSTPTLAATRQPTPAPTLPPTATPWPVPPTARMAGFTHVYQ